MSPDDPVIAQNLRTARERVQAEQQAKRDEDARRTAAQLSLGHLSDALKTIKGAADGKGLDFDSGTASAGSPKDSTALSFAPAPAPAALVVTDSMVVDARVVPWGSDLPKVAEIEQSPGAIPARRGLEAIANHNWPLALVMYQTALQMDPNNAALKRAVDMAQWMTDWHAKHDQPQRALQSSLKAIERRDVPGTRAALAEVKQLHPEWAPKDSDMEFLFDGMTKPRAADAEDQRYEKDIFSKGAVASNSVNERERTLIISLSQELHEEALLQLLMGDHAGFDKKLEQSKAVWRASEKLHEASGPQ